MIKLCKLVVKGFKNPEKNVEVVFATLIVSAKSKHMKPAKYRTSSGNLKIFSEMNTI